jgi:hypothetical protein
MGWGRGGGDDVRGALVSTAPTATTSTLDRVQRGRRGGIAGRVGRHLGTRLGKRGREWETGEAGSDRGAGEPSRLENDGG